MISSWHSAGVMYDNYSRHPLTMGRGNNRMFALRSTHTHTHTHTHYVNETKSTTTEDGRRALVNNSSSGHNKEDCH